MGLYAKTVVSDDYGDYPTFANLAMADGTFPFKAGSTGAQGVVTSFYSIHSDNLTYYDLLIFFRDGVDAMGVWITNTTRVIASHNMTLYNGYRHFSYGWAANSTVLTSLLTPYNTIESAGNYNDIVHYLIDNYADFYPITYRLTNCTAPNAPTEAAGGSDVVINITPTQGYILRSSGVSVMDSNGVTVPHIVQGNQIAFTMPYPP